MTETTAKAQTDQAKAQTDQARGGPGTWQLSWTGIRTVIRLELRQRVRSSQWKIILVIWALVLGAVTALLHYALDFEEGETGATLFGLIVYLVLSLGSLVAPGLSATSINGDRAAGVLATLQTTLLTPAELVLGKLLAAWLTSLAFLAVACPFLGWGFAVGGTPGGRLAVTSTLLAVMLLVVCGIGLGWSALTARSAASVALTYLTVAFMGVGLPMLFALSIPLVAEKDLQPAPMLVPVNTTSDGSGPLVCQKQIDSLQQVAHIERTWWLLAANPYVVLADASPKPVGAIDDPLSAIRGGVRSIRLGQLSDECELGKVYANYEAVETNKEQRRDTLGVSWPYGLAVNLALGVGGTVVAIRRLRTPTRKLPRGTRIA